MKFSFILLLCSIANASDIIPNNGATNSKFVDLSITTAKIADGSVTISKKSNTVNAQSSVAVDSSQISNGSYVDVNPSGLSTSITTTGRPVLIQLQSGTYITYGGSSGRIAPTGSACQVTCRIVRDGGSIAYYSFGQLPGCGSPGPGGQGAGAVKYLDIVSAGAHVYSFQCNSTGNFYSAKTILNAFEI